MTWLVALALLPAMGDAVAECAHLGPALVDHTCFHARLGPFAAVTAGTSSRPTTDTLDAAHTYYRVALGDRRSTTGQISYTPARTGPWAVFVQHEVPFEVRDAAGVARPVRHRDAVPGCPFLARVEVVELVAGVTYQLAIGPTMATAVGVVIENIDDFVVIQGRDVDGDGYGDPEDFIVGPCDPPAGYAANDGDCDDADREVHPGATERCDQPDRNCNGIAGDLGASCRVGVGACAVAAVAECPIATESPVCRATAGGPQSEHCNGVDDDCDGVVDGDGLCSEPDQPRCVADGRGGARCGCEVDADCGAPDGARLCVLDGAQPHCADGCVEGRNLCPAGLRCTSDDPAAPGTCARIGGTGGCHAGGASSGLAGVLFAGTAIRCRRRRGHGRGPRPCAA